MFVKVSPMSKFEQGDERSKDQPAQILEAIAQACHDYGVDGIIANNTSSEHEEVPADQKHLGGLSGEYITQQSIDTVEHISRYLEKIGSPVNVIGCGGIGYEE